VRLTLSRCIGNGLSRIPVGDQGTRSIAATAGPADVAYLLTPPADVRGVGNSVPSGPIDDTWHVALVFTKLYREFCSERVGRFVDHNPQEHSNPEGYDATRQTAAELFGQLDPRFWTDQVAECGSDCCND
jgi:hypothetical protein